jgi:predicted regulator of Ras-like GTPase activity (Roadblock/LC7/MglB family)
MVCPQAKPPRGPIEATESLKSDVVSYPDGAKTARSGVDSPPRGASLSVPPIAAPGEIAEESESAPTARRPATHKAAAKAPPIRVPTPQAPQTAKPGCVNVELASLSESWPPALRQEIAQWNLSDAKVALPAEPVREAMKRGRVAFPWGTLRGWITPEPPTAKSIDENATLELPLAIITPLFITGQKQSPKPPPKMAELDEIPDVFFGGRKSETSNSENGFEAREAEPNLKPEPVATAVESATAAVAPAISTVHRSRQAQPASEDAVMRIPLKQLTELWPEKVRSEVAQWNSEKYMVAVPADRINAALKQGKAVFSWENLRSWIVPTPPSTTSVKGETLLELPLPVIMPAFLAGQKQQGKSAARACPVIDDDIPDPFADFLPPRTTSAGTAVAKETPPAQIADNATATDSKQKTAKGKNAKDKKSKEKGKDVAEPTRVEKAAETNFLKRQETPTPSRTPAKVQAQAENAPSPSSPTPSEVLASAVGLEGVAGALVALSDGFKVASKLPAGLDGDALAAFLPHIFSKVNQSARELRMGDLTNLNFTVDNIPWKIFRVDKIFFAALGHAGQTMPTDQLAALAHKLTFKN